MTRTISTPELITATGVSTRQLYLWTERGYIAAEPGTLTGSGSRARWDVALVERLRIVLARIEWGMAVGPALFREVDPPLPSQHGWHLEVSERDGGVQVLATDGTRFVGEFFMDLAEQGRAA